MSKYSIFFPVAMVLLCAFAPAPSRANSIDTFVFQTCQGVPFTCGATNNTFSNTYTWQAPASPTPTLFNPIINPGSDVAFSITADVTGNGIDLGPQSITFTGFSVEVPPNFQIAGLSPEIIGFYNCAGCEPYFFTGPDSSPTFVPGAYAMWWGESGFPAGTLTISSAVATPEPSALIQTGAGLLIGVVLVAFWRRKTACANVSQALTASLCL